MTNKIITRRQLKALGMTQYHAAVITKTLQPIGRQSRAFQYLIADVIAETKLYLQRPRIKAATRLQLDEVLKTLLSVLDNVVQFVSGTALDPELSKLARELMHAMAKTDASLTALKLDVAKIHTTSVP